MGGKAEGYSHRKRLVGKKKGRTLKKRSGGRGEEARRKKRQKYDRFLLGKTKRPLLGGKWR